MALYPSGLRGRSAKPLFIGSNPIGASSNLTIALTFTLQIGGILKKFIAIFLPLILTISIVYSFALFFENLISKEEVDVVIMGIEESTTENGEVFYYVRTNLELFVNANNKFHKKDNANTLIKKLKIGQKYKLEVVGYKFGFKLPFFLKERNIIDIVEEDDILKKLRKY